MRTFTILTFILLAYVCACAFADTSTLEKSRQDSESDEEEEDGETGSVDRALFPRKPKTTKAPYTHRPAIKPGSRPGGPAITKRTTTPRARTTKPTKSTPKKPCLGGMRPCSYSDQCCSKMCKQLHQGPEMFYCIPNMGEVIPPDVMEASKPKPKP